MDKVHTDEVPPLSSTCQTLSVNVLFETKWGSHYIGYYSFSNDMWYCYHTSAEIGYNDEIAGWWYLPNARG